MNLFKNQEGRYFEHLVRKCLTLDTDRYSASKKYTVCWEMQSKNGGFFCVDRQNVLVFNLNTFPELLFGETV